MKAETCKQLQEIGAFVLAGGCAKRMKQVTEMISSARGYRWVGIYKIITNEFMFIAASDHEYRRIHFSNYPRLVRRGLGIREAGCCR